MSSGSSPPTGKKRKKPDSKPLSQLTKCINEKRRREQENVYIEELAELISASITDMSSLSVKPDKCAILQETVNQIRRIKEEADGSGNEVQEGEVSSSKPGILSDQLLGSFLLEALDGFLFVVNTEGKVEYVSDNVSSFLRYTPDDLIGKSIYNIIHVGDHARFSSSLLPTSLGWCSDLPSSNKSRIFNCRLLVKPPADDEETMEEKQTRVSQYETMQISAILQPYPGEKPGQGDGNDGGENQNCLVCVTRRIPTSERQPVLNTGGPPVEQFTTKLDVNGKVVAIDTSGVSSTYSQYLNKDLVGCIIQELCHPGDLTKMTSHLKETLQSGQSTSSVYRLRVTPPNPYENHMQSGSVGDRGNYIHVQTKSKRFPYNPGTNDMEFIMATHSIFSENEFKAPENPGSNLSRRPDMGSMSSLRSNEGNPVLTSVVRGAKPKPKLEPCEVLEPNITMNSGTSLYTDLNLNGFEFELFPTSTWDLNLTAAEEDPPPLTTSLASFGLPSTPTQQVDVGMGSWSSPARHSSLSRPNSRQSSTTPRPPSVPAYSPSTNLTGNPPSVSGPHSVPSPGTFSVPSPASRRHPSGSILLDNLTSPLGTAHHYTSQHHPSPGPVHSQYPFSPMLERPGSNHPEDTKEGLPGLLASRTPSGLNDLAESNRLREILERPSGGNSFSNVGYGEDGKGVEIKRENEQSGCGGRQQPRQEEKRSFVHSQQHGSSMGQNEILLSLLKDHNDDDESKAGVKKQNEILESLLNDTADRKQDVSQQERDEVLLKSLGFQPTGASNARQNSSGCDSQDLRGLKRPGDELNSDAAKTLKPEPSPTQGFNQNQAQPSSRLCERNKMLASLLAKAPSQVPVNPPNVPSPKPSALPQEKLPKNLKEKLNHDAVAAHLANAGVQHGVQPIKQLQSGTQSQLQALQRQQNSENSFLNALLVRPSGQGSQANQILLNSNTSAQKVLLSGQQVQLSGQQVQLQANVNSNGGVNISFVQSNLRVQGIQQRAQGRLVGDAFGDGSNGVESLPWELASSQEPSLSDILDQIIEMAPTYESQAESPPLLNPSPLPDVNERLAINAIQKSLMSVENVAQQTQNAAFNNLQTNLGTLSGNTLRLSQLSQLGMIQQQGGNGPINSALLAQTQQLLLQQRRNAIAVRQQQQQQQQQQVRLAHAQVKQQQLRYQQQQLRLNLQQQNQQHHGAQLSPSSLASIEDLLNASNPPNVSIQPRSEPPQASPGFSSPLLNSPGGNNQISPNPSRPAYSPHEQGSNFTQGHGPAAARSSPLGSLNAFQSGQGTMRAQVGSLSAPSPGVRQLQQQQQPQNQLLNAQLSAGLSNSRLVSIPRAVTPRSLSTTSPGPPTPLTPQARQSPYSVGGESPLPSPTSGYLQQQQLRLQRMGGGPVPQGGPPPYRPYGYPHYPYPPYPMPYRHHTYDPNYLPYYYQDPTRNPMYQYDNRLPHVLPNPLEPAYPSPSETGGGSVINTYSERGDGELTAPMVETFCDRRPPGGINTSSSKPEYVRQELRAVVGARQSASQSILSPSQSILSATLASPRGTQTHQIMGQQVRVPERSAPLLTQAELEAIGITLELPQNDVSDSSSTNATLSWESFSGYNPEDMITLQSAPSEHQSSEQKNSLLEQLLNDTK